MEIEIARGFASISRSWVESRSSHGVTGYQDRWLKYEGEEESALNGSLRPGLESLDVVSRL
jgi:hypothetical protein